MYRADIHDRARSSVHRSCIPCLEILLADLREARGPKGDGATLSGDSVRAICALLEEYQVRWFGPVLQAKNSREQLYRSTASERTRADVLLTVASVRRSLREDDLLSMSMALEPAQDSEEWSLDNRFPKSMSRQATKPAFLHQPPASETSPVAGAAFSLTRLVHIRVTPNRSEWFRNVNPFTCFCRS